MGEVRQECQRALMEARILALLLLLSSLVAAERSHLRIARRWSDARFRAREKPFHRLMSRDVVFRYRLAQSP